jgi:hypothetical protein
MTKFENMINDGKLEARNINAIINNLNDNATEQTFDAWINAKTLSEIDSKLPAGYETDRLTTLCNYFNPATVDKYEIELINSQYIYFTDFEILYNGGFARYIAALEKDDFNTINRLDRQYRK